MVRDVFEEGQLMGLVGHLGVGHGKFWVGSQLFPLSSLLISKHIIFYVSLFLFSSISVACKEYHLLYLIDAQLFTF
jgi:hypothetical protein